MSESTETHLGRLLDKLWDAEFCTWELRFDGVEDDVSWTVILTWQAERVSLHEATWVTLTWDFPDETPRSALAQAVQWCQDLEPFRQCPACDGRGGWGTFAEPTPCPDCNATGLAHPTWVGIR